MRSIIIFRKLYVFWQSGYVLRVLALLMMLITPQVQAARERVSSDPLKTTQKVATKGLEANQIRTRVTTENMANADTPNYVPKDVYLRAKPETMNGPAYVKVHKIERNPNKVERTYDPSNPMADAQGMVSKPKIDPLLMMMDIQTTRISSERLMKSYQAATDMRHRMSKMMNY